jgi:hypothetical protein
MTLHLPLVSDLSATFVRKPYNGPSIGTLKRACLLKQVKSQLKQRLNHALQARTDYSTNGELRRDTRQGNHGESVNESIGSFIDHYEWFIRQPLRIFSQIDCHDVSDARI